MKKEKKIKDKKVPKTSVFKKISKKAYIITGSIILVIAIVVAIIFLIKPWSNEKELEKNLKSIANEFYSEFYYKQLSDSYKADELVKKIQSFEKIGIKINLENLSRFTSSKIDVKAKLEKFVNSKTKKSCNKDTTQAIIYPKEPFGKNDFTVEVNIDCGFDKK